MDFLSGWRGKRVLVTGGSGFIGQHVVRQGVAAGVDLHNLSAQSDSPAPHNHHVDLSDCACVAEVVNAVKPEGIIHLAASGVAYGANELGGLLQANVIGLSNLLSAVVNLGHKPPVVLAGSGFEYRPQPRPLSEADPVEPFSPYGVSKACAALCAHYYAARLSVTLLRLFSVYGPGEKEPRLLPYLVECARRGQTVELTGCEQARDYTHVDDAAQSFWRALAASPVAPCWRAMNVGTGAPVTLKEFVLHAADALTSHGLMPELLFGAKPYRPGEPMTYVADVTHMKKVIGWIPQTGISDGVAEAVGTML